MDGGPFIGIEADRGQVVVIEDVPSDRALLAQVLSQYDYEITELDPSRAVEEIGRLSPRLIFLSADVHGGFNLCLRLKKDPVLRRVPLVLVTAKATPDMIRKHRMLPTRADAYLRKPLTPDAIGDTVRELLPGDFKAERDVSDVKERTLVHQGVVESAVVNYVEEEVSSLKEIVKRLESEKAELRERLIEIENQINANRERIDSGLKQIEQKPSEEILLEARRKGVEEGRRQAAQEGGAELTRLSSKVAELERELEEQRKAAELAEETAKAASRELLETTAIFERLETGYKSSLAQATAERSVLEEKIAALEAEVERLRGQPVQDEEVMALREAAKRAEVLDEECRGLKANVAAMSQDLERAREEATSLRKEVDELRVRAEAAAETEERLAATERALNAAREELNTLTAQRDAAMAEAEALRQRFAALRSILESAG